MTKTPLSDDPYVSITVELRQSTLEWLDSILDEFGMRSRGDLVSRLLDEIAKPPAMRKHFLLGAWILLMTGTALAQQPVQPLPKVGSCPLGYYSSGGYCVPSSGGNSRGAIEKREAGCPLGFYSSGNYCLSSPSNDREAIQKSGKGCPLGWYSSGGYCVKSR